MRKEKLSFSFSFSFHCALSHCVFSLTLSIFPFSFACSHSRSSSRLHQSLVSLAGTSLFSGTSHLHPIFTGRMASLFISSYFPSFLPFTLFTSSHNKCKSTYLDFASFLQLSLGVSNPTRNPTNPSNPPKPKPTTARTDHSDGR